MSKQPTSIQLGPFQKGINTALAPYLLDASEAVEAIGVDLTAGSLRGLYGPGSAVTPTSFTGSPMEFALAGNAVWDVATTPEWYCNDGRLLVTIAGVDTTYSVSYATSYGTTARPRMFMGNVSTGFENFYKLGVLPKNLAPSTVNGSSGGARAYAYTIVSRTKAQESNPTDRSATIGASAVTTCHGAALSNIFTDASPDGVTHRRIYATKENDPNGLLYFYAAIPNNTATTWTDNGATDLDGVALSPVTYAPDDTLPLNWGDGGNIGDDTTPYDHAAPGVFSVMAESFHAMTDDSGAGILFAAIGDTVRWSHTGGPGYWPAVHQHKLSENVEAILSHGPETFVFTQSAIYSFSGGADYAISPTKTGAAFGVRKGFGKTVRKTPQGIVFLSREGLALFDGNTVTVISKNVLSPSDFASYTYATSAYYDGYYFLAPRGASFIYRFDLSTLPAVRVVKDPFGVCAFHVTTKTSTAYTNMTVPSMYVLLPGGTIKPWRPSDGALVAGATRQPWSFKTGLHTLGALGGHKRLNWMLAAYNANGGTINATFKAGDDFGKSLTSTPPASFTRSLTGAGLYERSRLPLLQGHTFQIEIAGTTGAEELYQIHCLADISNAA